MVTVKDIYLTCENIKVDAEMHLYDSHFAFTEKIKPSYSLTYKQMPEHIANERVIKYIVDEPGKNVHILILR